MQAPRILFLPWNDQIALGLQYTGIDGYSEQRITFSYARQLFDKLSAGLQFDFNINDATEYDNIMVATWFVVVLCPFNEGVIFFSMALQPTGRRKCTKSFHQWFGLVFLYSPSDKIGLAVEAEKRLVGSIAYENRDELSLA